MAHRTVRPPTRTRAMADEAIAALVTASRDLSRAFADTTGADVASLIDGSRVSATPPVASWPAVEALRTSTLDGLAGRVRMPVPVAPAAAARQTAEKTEIPSRKVTITTANIATDTIALGTDLALQAVEARPYIEATLVAAVASGTDQRLCDRLITAAGVAVADVPTALAAVYAAGWVDVVVIAGPAAATANATAFAAYQDLGLTIVLDPHVTGTLVVARDGVSVSVDGPDLIRADRVGFAGMDLAAYCYLDAVAGTGAVSHA